MPGRPPASVPRENCPAPKAPFFFFFILCVYTQNAQNFVENSYLGYRRAAGPNSNPNPNPNPNPRANPNPGANLNPYLNPNPNPNPHPLTPSDAPLTPGQTSPPTPGRTPPRPLVGPPPDPQPDPPRLPAGPPPPTLPPPRVLTDSWGVCRIRTGCSRPTVVLGPTMGQKWVKNVFFQK